MKYFTRDFYNKMQPSYRIQKGLNPISGEAEKEEWEDVVHNYNQHLISIKASLPKSMQEFSAITLHDGIIKAVSRPSSDNLVLEIDGGDCCWGPVGQFTLIFKGVKCAEYPENIARDYWLYEEVHLADEGGFDYQVLLSRSELRVVADDVEFIIVESGNKEKEERLRKFLEERKKKED